MHNNSIFRLDYSVINYFKQENVSLNTLTLYNNPWSCDCDAQEMLSFVQKMSFKSNFNLKTIYCSYRSKFIYELDSSELCVYDYTIVIFISIPLAIFFLIFFLHLMLRFYCQKNIITLLYSYCKKPKIKFNGERFDAFISFSHEDEDFVHNNLVRPLELESEEPFKFCIHTRDWIPGQWIDEQIYKSIDNSKKTIIVLSKNFLASKWSLTEFRYAHRKCIEDNYPCLIILLYKINIEEIMDDIDSELQIYLKNITYIKWDEPCFSIKLKGIEKVEKYFS